jgi:hypothetical protein
MPRQVVARVLLVCAVLLAQQTALAHDLWHAAGAQSGAQDSPNPAGKKLCDLHDLLGTVLGAVGLAKLPVALLAFSDVRFSPVAHRPAAGRPLAPQSRGPPALS